jgi:hypothetical protein
MFQFRRNVSNNQWKKRLLALEVPMYSSLWWQCFQLRIADRIMTGPISLPQYRFQQCSFFPNIYRKLIPPNVSSNNPTYALDTHVDNSSRNSSHTNLQWIFISITSSTLVHKAKLTTHMITPSILIDEPFTPRTSLRDTLDNLLGFFLLFTSPCKTSLLKFFACLSRVPGNVVLRARYEATSAADNNRLVSGRVWVFLAESAAGSNAPPKIWKVSLEGPAGH